MSRFQVRTTTVAAVLCASLALGSAAPPAIQLPGATAFDADLQARLHDAWAAEATRVKPNAMPLNPDGAPRYINRLVFASSPYLQQHAFNPVNWYPWSEEAFAIAARDHKPIFLSIGYSTCHWCHVMEHECFEDEAIARLLNERFVAIKVDREERPDIDAVYVAAVERLTGSAGWPLTVLLTPDGKPFYGGTYFPPADQDGRPGLPKLLTTVANLWDTKRGQIMEASADLAKSLQTASRPQAINLSAATLAAAYQALSQSFDAEHSGFGRAPKFPQAHMLVFLLRYWQRTHEPRALHMVEDTLDRMARGGIHDHLGGGFHRYAVDAAWARPHFEKMLYDQAINARAYLEAYQATGNQSFADVARDIFEYVRRDLTASSGAFYSAEDADSEGEEGRFYLWSHAEVIAALGASDGPLMADFFGLTQQGGKQPLSIPVPMADFTRGHGTDTATMERAVSHARALLLASRDRRMRPWRDEKIITAWNGLMISALAYGSAVLNDPGYAAAAARAADFVLTRAQRNGRLLRSVTNDTGSQPGYLDDYAAFIGGLTDLYAATLETRWLAEADRLTRAMLALFGHGTDGALHYRANDSEQLIAASEDTEDGAAPSAQSLAALALLRLGRLTTDAQFEAAGRALLSASSPEVERAPSAHTAMLAALDFALGPTKEIVIAGAPEAPSTQALLTAVRHRYLPRSILALHAPGDGTIERLVPFVKAQTMIHNAPTAYVCENYVCKLPTNDVGTLEELLADARPPK